MFSYFAQSIDKVIPNNAVGIIGKVEPGLCRDLAKGRELSGRCGPVSEKSLALAFHTGCYNWFVVPFWYGVFIPLDGQERSVAKTSDKPEQDPDTPSTSDAGGEHGAQAASQPTPQRVQVEIDDSKALALYANFCRVTGTPEELIIDFGLNPQPFGMPTHPIPVTQRIITNFYTAKRMLHALQLTIQRHEATFGVLETDVQKRVRAGQARG
jgi:hypothetical protein